MLYLASGHDILRTDEASPARAQEANRITQKAGACDNLAARPARRRQQGASPADSNTARGVETPKERCT